MNGNSKHRLWAVNYIPAYCSGFCKCLGSCVPVIRWGELVPKHSAAVTATDPRPPACTLPSCPSPCCLPVWLCELWGRVSQPRGHSRLGDQSTTVPFGGPVRRGSGRSAPRAPSAPQRIGCGGGRPAGPAGVPRAGHCLWPSLLFPSPALSERISGRGSAMERRAATAAAGRRGRGGGGRERLARCRLAQRRGWALQREPGALRTVREAQAEGAEMRPLAPRCWSSRSLARRREAGKVRPSRCSAGAKGACAVPSSCFYPSPGAGAAAAPYPFLRSSHHERGCFHLIKMAVWDRYNL